MARLPQPRRDVGNVKATLALSALVELPIKPAFSGSLPLQLGSLLQSVRGATCK